MESPVQVETGETRAHVGDGGPAVIWVNLVAQELEDSRGPLVLQVHRDPEETKATMDQTDHLDSLDCRVDQERPVTRDNQEGVVLPAGRVNQEIQA